jgi:hypothetical protein
MSHVLSPSTVKALKLRQNGGTLRMLCRDLGIPETQAPVLSDVLRAVPGAVSLARENEIRAALNLPPRARRRYLRPCLSLDPAVRAGQLRALLAAAEAAMEETP